MLNEQNYRGEIKLFTTSHGERIEWQAASDKIKVGSLEINARGPYMCYTKDLTIHVSKITGTTSVNHEFPLPLDRFANAIWGSSDRSDNRAWAIRMVGFLGKSNILLFYLQHDFEKNPALFSLDIDAAVGAKTQEQVELAFSLPLAKKVEDKSVLNNRMFSPVYQTDRENHCVDLVGVMHQVDKRTVESNYFVTEMQCQDIDL